MAVGGCPFCSPSCTSTPTPPPGGAPTHNSCPTLMSSIYQCSGPSRTFYFTSKYIVSFCMVHITFLYDFEFIFSVKQTLTISFCIDLSIKIKMVSTISVKASRWSEKTSTQLAAWHFFANQMTNATSSTALKGLNNKGLSSIVNVCFICPNDGSRHKPSKLH